MNNVNGLWIFEYLMTFIAGFLIVFSAYYLSKRYVEEKFDHYGYQIKEQKITYRKAFFNCCLFIIPRLYVFVLGLAVIVSEHFWDIIILGSLIVLPLSIMGIEKEMNEMVKDAKKDD